MGGRNRSNDWFRQAEADLRWGFDSLKTEHYAQVCFIAQQVAEKALKSLAFYKGFDLVKGHSVLEICKALEMNGELLDGGKKLDQYYITTRYPDAMPAGAPFEFFTEAQASEALKLAELFLEKVRGEIK